MSASVGVQGAARDPAEKTGSNRKLQRKRTSAMFPKKLFIPYSVSLDAHGGKQVQDKERKEYKGGEPNGLFKAHPAASDHIATICQNLDKWTHAIIIKIACLNGITLQLQLYLDPSG